MTTEILRNKLYTNCTSLANLEWVIFDEVHYINNEDRGSVWEETIILLPKLTNIVMLSATVENVEEFGDWVSRITKKPMQVIKTSFRPVPLKHFLYFGKEHLVKSGNENTDINFIRTFKAKLEENWKLKQKMKQQIKNNVAEKMNQLKEMKNQKARVSKISRKKTNKNQMNLSLSESKKPFNREEKNVD